MCSAYFLPLSSITLSYTKYILAKMTFLLFSRSCQPQNLCVCYSFYLEKSLVFLRLVPHPQVCWKTSSFPFEKFWFIDLRWDTEIRGNAKLGAVSMQTVHLHTLKSPNFKFWNGAVVVPMSNRGDFSHFHGNMPPGRLFP